MNTDRDDPLLRRARDAFEGAVDDVDPATANRLRLARRAALSTTSSPRGWLLPLAGAAAMGLLAWLAWPRAQAPAVATIPVAPAPAVVVAPGEPIVEAPAVDPPIDDAPVDDDIDWAALDPAPAGAGAPGDPVVESPAVDPLIDDVPIDDDTDWAALDDEDAEVYAWLADAPVAPDTGEDAL